LRTNITDKSFHVKNVIVKYQGADKSLARPTSRFKDILREKGREKFTKGALFLHDNVPAHRALATQKKLACMYFQCLVSFLVGLRTYQHPFKYQVCHIKHSCEAFYLLYSSIRFTNCSADRFQSAYYVFSTF
jgi:hypothetical protein